MPYIPPRQVPFAKLGRLLRGYGLNSPQLAEALGVAKQTALTRLKYPGLLTLEELAMISEKAHIPMQEIRDSIVK